MGRGAARLAAAVSRVWRRYRAPARLTFRTRLDLVPPRRHRARPAQRAHHRPPGRPTSRSGRTAASRRSPTSPPATAQGADAAATAGPAPRHHARRERQHGRGPADGPHGGDQVPRRDSRRPGLHRRGFRHRGARGAVRARTDFPRLVERLRARKAEGYTALYDASACTSTRRAAQQGRKVLVLYSDGGDNSSHINFSETDRPAEGCRRDGLHDRVPRARRAATVRAPGAAPADGGGDRRVLHQPDRR